MELKYRTAPAALDGDGEGRIKAAFSVFDELDSDQDIVRKSAFTDGQPVPLVWSHQWDKPIGKGVVRLTDRHAEFDGQFFTDTAAGMDAYRTVKAMGELQEFSFGFEVNESKRVKHQDKDAREITKVTLFEVSPVLVGANRNTRLLAIKGQERIDEQAGRVRSDLGEYIAREQSLADLRAKEGRALSTQRRTRLEQMRDVLRGGLEELEALLEETTPRQADDESDTGEQAKQRRRIEADGLALLARTLGVSV